MTLDQPTRTFVCSVVYVDLVGYSKRSVSEQITVKEAFNRHLASALREIPAADRIILDTGDGAAMSFLGDPEEALFVALCLRDSIEDATAGHVSGGAHGGEPGRIRVGINLGPVKLASDVNGHSTIVGDGINVAETIMGFAKPGKIAVSRSFFEMVSRLSPDYAKLFEYKGSHTDELVRDHEIYIVEQTDHAFRLAQRGMRGHHADERAAEKAAEQAAKHEDKDALPFVPVAPPPPRAGSGSALIDFLEDGWKVSMTAALLVVLIAYLAYLHWQRLANAKPSDAIAAAGAPASAPAATPNPVVAPPAVATAQTVPARAEAPAAAKPEPARKAEAIAPAKTPPVETKAAKAASAPVVEARPAPTPVETKPFEPAPPRKSEPPNESPRVAARRAELERERLAAAAASARPQPGAPQPATALPVQPTAPPVEAPKEVAPAQNVSLNTVVPISRPPPVFPKEAAKEGVESGTVRARLRIDSSGNVYNVNILESNPPRVFDRAARAALTTWKFNAGADNRTFEVEIGFQR